MKDFVTPKQVSRAIGTSEASVKRWCDRGRLPCARTAGGHRRLPLSGVIAFLHETGHELVRPEVLGLPSNAGKGAVILTRAAEPMAAALEQGDDEQFDRLAFHLYLAGHAQCAICDQAITPAFGLIGTNWEHGRTEIYQERRAVEICLRTLARLRLAPPPPPADAPTALGGAPAGDAYHLPTAMVELTLREAGWRAASLGCNLPFATLRHALRTQRPRLFWLCAAVIDNSAEFVAEYETLFALAQEQGVAVVVGGRALTEDLRRSLRYSAFCDNLQHLVAFARTLVPPRTA